MPYTRQEFAASIKAKYPSYKSWDDDKLVDSILAKYPQYQKQIVADAPPAPSGDFNAAHRRNAQGELRGSEADLPTTPVQKAASFYRDLNESAVGTGISGLTGVAEAVPQFGAAALDVMRDTATAGPVRRFAGAVTGGEAKPMPAPAQQAVTSAFDKGRDLVRAAAGVTTPLTVADAAARFTGNMVDPLAPYMKIARNGERILDAEKIAAKAKFGFTPEELDALKKAGWENTPPEGIPAFVDKHVAPEAAGTVYPKNGNTAYMDAEFAKRMGADERVGLPPETTATPPAAPAVAPETDATVTAIRENLATPRRNLSGKVGAAKAVWRDLAEPMTLALQKSGPVGQEIASGLYAADRSTAQNVGSALYDLEQMKKFTPEEKTLFVDIMEGRVDKSTLDPSNRVVQSVEKQRALLDTIGKRSEELGLKVMEDGKEVPFQMRENYMPHPATAPKGKAEPILPASGKVGGGTVEGGLRHHRGDGSEFSGDPAEALAGYYSKAYRQLAEAEQFGLTGSPKDFHAAGQEWAEKAAASGEDANYTKRAFATSLGEHYKENGALSNALNAARTWQSTTKLTTAAIPNITQTANTIAEAGIKNVFKSIVDSGLTKRTASREFAARSGAIYEGMLYNFMDPSQNTGIAKLQRAIMSKTGFALTERWNRTIAANAAPYLAEDLLKAAAKGGAKGNRASARLLKMGVSKESILAGQLTDTDKYNAAFNLSHKSQFGNRPEDLPLTWESSDTAKVVTQFKSFALKQSYFTARLIHEATVNKNPLPLMKFVAASGLSGEALSHFNSLVSGYEREDKPIPQRLAEDLLTAGTFGMFVNMLSGVGRKRYDVVAESIAGPTFGDIVRTTADPSEQSLKRDIKPYRIGKRIYDSATSGDFFPYQRH